MAILDISNNKERRRKGLNWKKQLQKRAILTKREHLAQRCRCKLLHAGTEKSQTDNGVPAWSPADMLPSITVSAGVCLIAGMLWRAGSSSAVNLSFSSSAFAWHVWTHTSHFCAIRELNCSSPISHNCKMVGVFSFPQFGSIQGT